MVTLDSLTNAVNLIKTVSTQTPTETITDVAIEKNLELTPEATAYTGGGISPSFFKKAELPEQYETLPTGLTTFREGGTSALLEQATEKATEGVQVKLDIPIVENIEYLAEKTNPLNLAFTGIKTALDYFTGNREDIVTDVIANLPVVNIEQQEVLNEELTTTTKTGEEFITDVIEKQKELSPENAAYWEQPATSINIDLGLPEIPNINFGDVGKWLVIAGAALAGVYLLGQFIGGKK